MRRLVNLTEKDGCLHITPVDSASLEEIREIHETQAPDAALGSVLEWYLCSGWEWVQPEEIGALTDAPLLSQEVVRDEDGNLLSVGTVYYDADYMLRDPIATLIERGSAIFRGSR